MGLFQRLFSTNTKKLHAELAEITSRIDPDEGFADIFLNITQATERGGRHVYIAKGLHKGTPVGLQCEILSGMPTGIVDGRPDSTGFIREAVIFKSIGEESDRFVGALSSLYELTGRHNFSQQPIVATAFSLNEKRANFNKPNKYRFKLFFEEDSDELYSEIFLNIDTSAMELEFAEKDLGYRENIIKVLST